MTLLSSFHGRSFFLSLKAHVLKRREDDAALWTYQAVARWEEDHLKERMPSSLKGDVSTLIYEPMKRMTQWQPAD